MKQRRKQDNTKICVVIPAYKVSSHILEVVQSIGPEVHKIIVVDDNCPEKSGELVEKFSKDKRLEVIFLNLNLGVGGAVKTGYKRALELNQDIIVKIDGDGQMDASKIKELTEPIIVKLADYTKGNRFFNYEAVIKMPKMRMFGNLGLTFMTKLSSGYWHVFDPNNGFTAINLDVLKKLNLSKIDNGYFFESDMLFRLNMATARVLDISIPAIYDGEKSNLNIGRVLFEFPIKHLRNFLKRIIYSYYLRDFNLASIELPIGLFLFLFGMVLGSYCWVQGILQESATQTGTLILIAMSVLLGLQLILAFLAHDTKK